MRIKFSIIYTYHWSNYYL